jgi:hypothetical protein
MDRPVPNLAQRPLAFSFDGPTPKPAPYQQGTAEFRYWTAAEALRRGADFWANLVSLQRWQPGPVLKVLLDEGVDLNAFYDRNALNFFHGPSPNGTVFSDESPDIVCHEMGHAILDSLKPQLWGVGSHEAAAFHESFGDISAILSALQLQELRPPSNIGTPLCLVDRGRALAWAHQTKTLMAFVQGLEQDDPLESPYQDHPAKL